MDYETTMAALKRLKVETGSLACAGCGKEHNCGVHGCAIIQEALEHMEAAREKVVTLETYADGLEEKIRADLKMLAKSEAARADLGKRLAEALQKTERNPDQQKEWTERAGSLRAAVEYFEEAIRESDEIIEDCTPALKRGLEEQREHFRVAVYAMEGFAQYEAVNAAVMEIVRNHRGTVEVQEDVAPYAVIVRVKDRTHKIAFRLDTAGAPVSELRWKCVRRFRSALLKLREM